RLTLRQLPRLLIREDHADMLGRFDLLHGCTPFSVSIISAFRRKTNPLLQDRKKVRLSCFSQGTACSAPL
ncbi:MAG: hypothetical protein IKM54_02710, partial [Butyricicoccus sp.]|nr:hypothetical protein [Butyricicoccus sp.]